MGCKTLFVLLYLCLNIKSNYAQWYLETVTTKHLPTEGTIVPPVGTSRVTVGTTTTTVQDLAPVTGYNIIPGFKLPYKFYKASLSWDEAKETCVKEGATLFYPESKEEFDTVLAFGKEKETFTPNELFLGMERTTTGFKTLDGVPESSVYVNWKSGEPNNSGGKEDCVHTYYDETWVFNDFTCSSIKRPFICKSKLERHPQCQVPTRLHYTYTEQLGKCYKFHLTPKTWSEARDVCRAENSDLAVINSQEEAQYLVSLTRAIQRTRIPGSFLHGAIHLGFHKNNVEDWQTIEETSLYDSGYACWGNSQPDATEQETCGAMFYNGHLTDVKCDERAFFICEHNIPGYAYEPPTAIKSLECYDDIQIRFA